ncbi:hypothetical protein AM1_B0117 (plasmid) [Acaryochloris marina MBIC11017]|uniref:Uncharacterized protein n=1 Tax=Acaryochloris marina (strain MBIC 11017) TaxID=329726 RepID=A8ZM73_ACAM1|nr:hypothetical protein AM1_B0117 [Acaryochloris marina MBIC11017]
MRMIIILMAGMRVVFKPFFKTDFGFYLFKLKYGLLNLI